MIKIIYDGSEQIVNPTIFPDKTSQVWKLDLSNYPKTPRTQWHSPTKNPLKVVWNFEFEQELIWVNQLICLLFQSDIVIDELYIPYLPYGRQDKEVSNELTFAREVFLEILMKERVRRVSTLDSHSYSRHIDSYSASRYINRAIKEYDPNVLVFPDYGAYHRYKDVNTSALLPVVVLDKVRDQKTGWITSLKLDEKYTDMNWWSRQHIMSNVPKFLIIDDICDGGATFNRASIFIHDEFKHSDVALYVTHGIYSKGFDEMIDSGISRFYTTQSLISNVNGYKLEEL
jgi:phosphoribosylpyrophosphate synthetase